MDLYITYTTNLGLTITTLSREGSISALKGARGSTIGQYRGAASGHLKWRPTAFGLSYPRYFQYLEPRLLPQLRLLMSSFISIPSAFFPNLCVTEACEAYHVNPPCYQ